MPKLDDLDKKILQKIQYDFPLAERPFKILAQELGLLEEEIIERIKLLKEKGIIRRIGGVFSSKNLGYTSLLCAIKVPEEEEDRLAAILNQYPGITHNYKRNHDYNIWFTLISANEDEKTRIIREIEEKTGKLVKELPAKKLFKLRAVFNVK